MLRTEIYRSEKDRLGMYSKDTGSNIVCELNQGMELPALPADAKLVGWIILKENQVKELGPKVPFVCPKDGDLIVLEVYGQSLYNGTCPKCKTDWRVTNLTVERKA